MDNENKIHEIVMDNVGKKKLRKIKIKTRYTEIN